jgi:hypothetical protein
MANSPLLRRLPAAAGLALGCLAVAPADAQFMSGPYPVVVVPPPPAQGMVMPKRPRPPQPVPQDVQAPPADDQELSRTYQGRAKVR